MTTSAIDLPRPIAPSDGELIAAVRGGSAVAEEALFRRHAPRVHRLAWRLVRDTEQARDLAQEAFARAFAMLPGFRGEAAFTTWLHRVTVTTCLNALRRDRRRTRDEVRLTPAAEGVAMDTADPALLAALEDAIAALPETHRLPLVMHALEGWSHQEIAATLDITEGTSRRRLFEARAALRAALDRPAPSEGA